jgi:hypothetical protein
MSVSRSGHCTLLSSAQHEIRNERTAPRRRSSRSAGSLRSCFARALRRCSFSRSRRARRSSRLSFAGAPTSARDGAGASGSATSGSGSATSGSGSATSGSGSATSGSATSGSATSGSATSVALLTDSPSSSGEPPV